MWGEFAAETVAIPFLGRPELEEFRKNDALYLAGIHGRVRQSVSEFRRGELDPPMLWGRSVTSMFNLFSNLGRSVARLSKEDGAANLVGRLPDSGLTATWSPLVESLVRDLRTLSSQSYGD